MSLRTKLPTLFPIALVSASLVLGCGDDYLSKAELMDPETCKDCHPKHFEEWQSSMHAYAGDDPIFLAMNRRGQRETNGALGRFLRAVPCADGSSRRYDDRWA